MKRVSPVVFLALFYFGASAADLAPGHYQKYESKVTSCIAIEKLKEPVSADGFEGLDRNVIATGLFYLKDKRLVECSASEELDSLARVLATKAKPIDLPALRNQYLSIGLVDKEKEFLALSLSKRSQLNDAVNGKGLEVDLIELFDAIDSSY